MTTDYSDAVDALYPAKDAEAPAVMQSPGNRGLPNDVSTATPFREPVEAEPNTTEPKPTLIASVGPTPKAAPRGEYDDAVDQVLARKDADTSANGFLSWKAANPGIDHEKAVDVLRYAEASGFSPDYVAQHIDVVKGHVDASQVDVEQLAQKSPALRDALLEKPTLVPAVKDDLPKLSLLEELFTDPWRATAQIPFAVGDAVMQQAIVARQFAKAKGWGGLENDKAIEELKAEYPEGKDYGVHSVLGGYIIGGAKLAPYGVLDYLGGLTGGYAGAAGGGAVGAAVGAVAGLAGAGAGAVPGAASGGAVGEAVGGVAGAMLGSGAVNYFETLGPLREEIGKLRDENGQAIPKEIADAYAEHYALLTGGLLGVGGPIGGSRLAAGVYKKVILKAVAEDATKTLLEPGAIALAKRFAGRYGMHELSAFLIGGAQAGLAESAQEGAMEESGQPFDMTDRSVSGVAFKGGVQMAKDMALLSGAHAGMETMADRDRADGLRVVLKYQAGQLATSKSAEQLHSIVDLVGSAEQFKKLPDGEKSALLERMAKQSGTPNVYVDREGWDRYWQGQKADPAAQAQRVVGDDGSAYANAHNASGELVIPLEKFAAFAASDNAHAKALVDESRLYQEGASPRVARENQAKFQKRAADLAKMDPTQMPPDARQVYDDYYARAAAAGRGEKESDANAKLVAAGFQSWAERFTDGGSPTKAWDLYRRQDVTITGGRGQGLAPGDINAQVEPETLKSMREAYAKSEPVAKRQEFFTDRTTGLYNFRGYEARKADPARPYTTKMELAGIKTVNDELGHATADASLKVMAEATRAAGIPDAMRRGTTISFDHATPEHGEAVAKAAQEAIGHGQVVTHGTTKAEGLMGPEDRLKAADEAHRTAKEAGREAGTVPQRGAPLNPEGKGLLPHLASIKRSELAPVLPEHEASYAEHLEKQDPFDTVHLTKGGSLTEDGFRLAEDLAVERAKATGEKVYYLSADARGIKAIHEAFASGLHEDVAGRPTDAVMEEMEHVLREAGGARFNVARPHGDEFYAVVVGENDKKRLEAMFKDAAAQAERRVFWRLDGEHVVVQNGVKLAFGTGETFDAADREALPEAKREQGDATAPERLGHEAFNDFARGLGPEHQLVRVGPAGRQGRQGRGVQAETGGVESGSGVGSERPVYVDPEITLHPTAKVPTERAMADAEAVAADMRSPIRKAVTEDFLDHVRSFLAGDQPNFNMSDLPRDIENALSKFGIVDPENGYRSEEDLQHLGRGGEKKQVGTTEYDRSTREDKAAQLRKNLGKLGQPAPAEPNLLVQHNIREAGLKHADELGGLAAPSLAISRKEYPSTNFGEVTLLAHPKLADPERGVPVFASDIYSTRHPRADHNVVGPALAKVEKYLAPFAKETGTDVGQIKNHVAERGAAGVAKERSIRPALELAFLKGKGIDLETPMRDARLSHDISEMPALRYFFSKRGADHNFQAGDAYHDALSKSVLESIDQFTEKRGKPRLAAELKDDYLSKDGRLRMGMADSLLREAKLVGTKERDTYAFEDAIQEKVDEVGRDEFERWSEKLLRPVVGARFIRKVSDAGNVRRIPYTLENVLKEVTRKIRQGEDFNYGLGTARAAGSKRLRSIADIQKARDRITSRDEFKKLKDENDKRFNALLSEMQMYHPNGGNFGVADALARSIGESYKRGRSLARELVTDGFKDVPPELVAKVSDFAHDLLEMPTEYFEAKPQRAVGIGEFRAAVVPHDASPETLQILRKHGITDVETYHRDDEQGRQAAIARVAEHTQILFQPPEGGAFTLDSKRGRGSISFDIGGTGKRRTFNIEILKGSDTSTLAHETFHFLSEVMADLAADPKAPADIKADYATMVKEMGYVSPEARLAESEERRTLNKRVLVWDRMTKEEKAANPDAKPTAEEKARLLHLTAKEERGSHGWEQYLLEGKTPSVALAGTFARFRNWLTWIYKSILGVQDTYKKNYGEELGLSDTMRRVFDRILASDKEVEKQQSAADAQPMTALFKDATPEQREAYEKTYAEAKEAAKTEMLKRLAEADKTENNAYFTGERERIRGEVEKELPGNKVYEAVRQLQGGVDVDGKVYKLDRKSLTKAYGKEYVATIGHKDIFAGKEDKALSADALAPLLGFEKGDELVRAIQVAPPRDRYIAGEVQRRMEDLHGPALIDSDQGMAEEALDSIHNPKAVERALMERRRLAEKLNPEQARRVPRIDEDVLKATAERMVAQRTVGELIAGDQGAAGYYLRAERTAARKAREAAEAGKWSEAIGENEKQLLNMFMWREATDLRERMNVLGRALKQSTKDPWRTELGKADVAAGGDHVYLGVHDAILQAVGGEDPAPPVGPMLDALDALVKAVGQDGLGFDPTALRDLLAKPTPWSDLTSDQAENVIASVKSIRHAASNQTELEFEGKRIDRAAWYANAQEHSDYGKRVPKPAAESAGEKVVQKIGWAQRGFDAWLTSIDSYIETLDNGDLSGPWHQLFVHDRHVARATLVELDKRIVGGVRTAMEAMPKKMQARLTERVPELSKILPVSDRYVDEIEAPETRSALYTLFLNAGNADNRQRLRDGNGWSDDQVNKALQLLHPEEAKFLQGILDTVESLHPDLAKVHERRTGMPLGKVVATPITIGGETFRGGYFPIRYDPKITRQGAVQMSDVEAGLFPQGMHSPTVYSGHTKARMEKVLAPVSLEFSTVQTHLAQVVQDIAMGDWVRKAASITLDDRFKKIVDKRLGPERTALFMPWLWDIANDRAGAVAAAAEGTPGFIRTASAITRNVYSSGVMALNLGSMLAHLTDPLAALGEAHGPVEMVKRTGYITSAYLKTLAPGVRPEHELSKDLDYRDSRETANIRIELDRMRLPTTPGLREAVKVRRAVEHVATLVRHRLDLFHSKLLWQIGFDEGIAKGMSMEDAAKAGDSLLTKTLPSGDIAERPALLRSKHSFAAVVLFHGYSNKMFNLWVHAPMARARDAFADRGWNSVPGSAADLAAKWIVMGAVGALGAKLAGRGPKDDDDAGEWAVTRLLMEPFASTPLGPFLEGGVQVATGEKFQASPRTVPEAQVVSDFAVGFGRAVHKAMEGEGGDDLVWQTVQTLAGVGLGPAGQIRKTAGYIHGVATGDVRPEGPLDVAKGVVYGLPRGR